METKQLGNALVESMVAMLIFCVGILGLTALELSLVHHDVEAKMRTQASLFADGLIGMITADAANAACYAMPVPNSGPAGCGSATATQFATTWYNTVTSTLPNSSVTSSLTANQQYTVTITWQRQGNVTHTLVIATDLDI